MTLNNNPSRFHLTFEWHSLLRDLLRNLWLVVLAALIVHMGIYVAERSVCSPDYTSSATLAVRARTGTSGTYANLSVSSDMAGIFATVFKDSSMQFAPAGSTPITLIFGFSIFASVLTPVRRPPPPTGQRI